MMIANCNGLCAIISIFFMSLFSAGCDEEGRVSPEAQSNTATQCTFEGCVRTSDDSAGWSWDFGELERFFKIVKQQKDDEDNQVVLLLECTRARQFSLLEHSMTFMDPEGVEVGRINELDGLRFYGGYSGFEVGKRYRLKIPMPDEGERERIARAVFKWK